MEFDEDVNYFTEAYKNTIYPEIKLYRRSFLKISGAF
jgi:hypothetical protein